MRRILVLISLISVVSFTASAHRPCNIQVLKAIYGGNCGAGYFGDVTDYLQNSCNGQVFCRYHVSHFIIGDPAYGCPKDLVVQYSCGNGQIRQTSVPPEASGQTLYLMCY